MPSASKKRCVMQQWTVLTKLKMSLPPSILLPEFCKFPKVPIASSAVVGDNNLFSLTFRDRWWCWWDEVVSFKELAGGMFRNLGRVFDMPAISSASGERPTYLSPFTVNKIRHLCNRALWRKTPGSGFFAIYFRTPVIVVGFYDENRILLRSLRRFSYLGLLYLTTFPIDW